MVISMRDATNQIKINGGKKMKTKMKKETMLVLILMFIVGQVMTQNTGREIMLKVDQQPDGDTRKSLMTMELVNKRDRKRVRSMNSYSKDYGKDKKSIMFFQEPADVTHQGQLYLVLNIFYMNSTAIGQTTCKCLNHLVGQLLNRIMYPA